MRKNFLKLVALYALSLFVVTNAGAGAKSESTTAPDMARQQTAEAAPAAAGVITLSGSLQATLDALVSNGTYKSINDIESLTLKGKLSNADWALLKKMCTAGAGYKLQDLDLTEVVNEKMAANQFNGCTQLRSIVFPKAMRDNGERVCQGCTSLESAKFNEGVEYVCNHFFNGCENLGEVWIPSTVTYLYGSSFEKCAGLTKIHLRCKPLQIIDVVRSPSQPTTNSLVFFAIPDFAQPKASELYVPSEYVELYESQDPDPQNVTNRHLENYLSKLTYHSKEWATGGPAFEWKPGTSPLKNCFVWSNADTKVIAEDSWD